MDGDRPELSVCQPCSGNVYVAYTAFHGASGNSPIMFSRSSDGGATFSTAADLIRRSIRHAVQPGRRHRRRAGWPSLRCLHAFQGGCNPINGIAMVKSTDCGRQWSQPVFVGPVNDPQAPGVAFRTPTFAFVSADDTDPNVVYVAYQSFAGDYDIYVQRSTDGGATWGAAGAGQPRPRRAPADLPDHRRPTASCTWPGMIPATASPLPMRPWMSTTPMQHRAVTRPSAPTRA